MIFILNQNIMSSILSSRHGDAWGDDGNMNIEEAPYLHLNHRNKNVERFQTGKGRVVFDKDSPCDVS